MSKVTLEALRVNMQLTQDQAAKALGISVSTLGNYERGERFPNVPMIEKIEALYNTTYKDINFYPNITI